MNMASNHQKMSEFISKAYHLGLWEGQSPGVLKGRGLNCPHLVVELSSPLSEDLHFCTPLCTKGEGEI